MFNYFGDLQNLLVILVSQHLTIKHFHVESLKLITQMGWNHDCVASDCEFNP